MSKDKIKKILTEIEEQIAQYQDYHIEDLMTLFLEQVLAVNNERTDYLNEDSQPQQYRKELIELATITAQIVHSIDNNKISNQNNQGL